MKHTINLSQIVGRCGRRIGMAITLTTLFNLLFQLQQRSWLLHIMHCACIKPVYKACKKTFLFLNPSASHAFTHVNQSSEGKVKQDKLDKQPTYGRQRTILTVGKYVRPTAWMSVSFVFLLALPTLRHAACPSTIPVSLTSCSNGQKSTGLTLHCTSDAIKLCHILLTLRSASSFIFLRFISQNIT